jgi:hypothetical protein
MSGNELINQVLDDLAKVKRVLTESHSDRLPYAALRYLAANSNLITGIVDLVYSKLDKAGRLELLQTHRELDDSATSDSFRALALHAVDTAADWANAPGSVQDLFVVSEDDLAMLRRALQYGKYIDSDSLEYELQLSPIEQHGLTRPAGNFEKPLTDQERSAVPWHLCEVVYDEQKSKVFEQCRQYGFDLDNHKRTPKSTNLNACIDLLADLLRYKMECLIACVLTQKGPRERFHNSVIGSVDYEAGLLIHGLRETLLDGTAHSNSDHWTANEMVEPLREKNNKLLSRVSEIQPRLEVFSAVSKLNADRQLRGDTVMGDKYEGGKYEVGQAVVVGEHAHVHDATFNLTQLASNIDAKKLAEELNQLRTTMQKDAASGATAEQQAEIGNVASAEIEAKKGNTRGAIECLKKAGKWTFETATKIGISVVADLIKKQTGL